MVFLLHLSLPLDTKPTGPAICPCMLFLQLFKNLKFTLAAPAQACLLGQSAAASLDGLETTRGVLFTEAPQSLNVCEEEDTCQQVCVLFTEALQSLRRIGRRYPWFSILVREHVL